jgi:DMSO reductase family type II enzyme heme b subunit
MRKTVMRQRSYFILFLVPLLIAGCGKGVPESTVEVVASFRQTLPLEPGDPEWDRTPLHVEPLLLQDLVEPRLLEPSTREARLRAFTDGTRIAFRIEWDDETRDDLPSASRFPDTCAVQLPLKVERDAPDPQMGEPGRPVAITFWSAFWQSSLDGRADTINELHPGATVDHYPFQAKPLEQDPEAQKTMELRYAPARLLGNFMAGPRGSAVQDLIAEGPGTLSPSEDSSSSGSGQRTDRGWAVVIMRPIPWGRSAEGQAQVAVAIANGSRGEAGSRKMRSAWVPLILEEPQ